ncbi:MAG: hypothetical protein AAB209_02905 [Bacteroidota bacterium]|jgi:hypothetical protein
MPIILTPLQDKFLRAFFSATKDFYLTGGTEIKDLLDLYFLDKAGYTIPENFEAAKQKDGGLSAETLAYTLNQFQVREVPPFMLKPLTVDNLSFYLEATISWLIQQSTPPAFK